MGMYRFINWQTLTYRRDEKTIRYAKGCVVSVENPNKVLAIVPFFNNYELINIVYNHELGLSGKDDKSYSAICAPIKGEFVDVPSMHGPLFRRFTKDDAKYALCANDQVGKVERTSDGKVKIYHSINLFICTEGSGWNQDTCYYHYFGYNYDVISNLAEPLRI